MFSGKKSALERQNDALNELTNLTKAYNERLTLECNDWGQRYCDGRLKVALKLRSRSNGQEFHLIISRLQIGTKDDLLVSFGFSEIQNGFMAGRSREIALTRDGEHMAAVSVSVTDKPATTYDEARAINGGTEIDRLNWPSMSLVSCVIMQGSEVLIPSRMGFCLLDEFDGISREELFQFRKFGIEFLHVVPEREANLIDLTPMFVRDVGNHIVERLPQILKDVFCQGDHAFGNAARAKLENFFGSIRIEVGLNGVSVSRKPFLDCGIELLDVGIGPFDLSVRPNKRVLFHDLESVMAKTDDLKSTKALMGALVRMKPKPHEEMKVGKKTAVKKPAPKKKPGK